MRNKMILAGILLSLSSCATHVFKENVTASTKSKGLALTKELGQVESRDCSKSFLFFFVPMNPQKMYSTILENAQSMGGDGIIDFQMRSDGYTYLYPFFFSDCWKATGTAVKFQKDLNAKSSWDNPTPTSDSSVTKVPSKWDSNTLEKTKK